MRTLQVIKCDMSIIRQVVKCDMSPGGAAALRCDAIIAMSWSVGQRTRDKGRGRAGSAREEGARAGGEAQSGRAGRAGWSPDLNLSLTNQLAGRPTKLIVRYSRADIYWTRPSQFLLPIILNEPSRGYGFKRKAFKFYESG